MIWNCKEPQRVTSGVSQVPSLLQNLMAKPNDSKPPGHLSMSLVPGCVLAHITLHVGSELNGHPLNAVCV